MGVEGLAPLTFIGALATVVAELELLVLEGSVLDVTLVLELAPVVLTGATVTKITFRPGSSPAQATGVEFLHDDNKHHVKVIKEVILSAGELLSSVVDVELGIEQRVL